jgi:hypothetical protein
LYGLFTQRSSIFSGVFNGEQKEVQDPSLRLKECQEIALISPTAGM